MQKELNVQAFRGLLMLWIVLFHYTYRITELYPKVYFPLQFENGGPIGVMFFFVISGYFLFNGILNSKQLNITETFKFMTNKYWRLWSLYIYAILLIFIITSLWDLPGRTITLKEFFINCLLIYHPKIEYVDSAHWFISNLIIVQCLFSMFLLAKKDIRRKLLILYEIFLILVFICNTLFHDFITHKLMWMLCVESSIMVLLGFNLLNIKNKVGGIDYILAIIILVYYTITINMVFVPVYAILTYIVFYHKESHLVLKPLIYIGNYGFGWYLIHQNIGYLIILYFYNRGYTDFYILIIPLVITFIISLALQYLANLFPKKILK